MFVRGQSLLQYNLHANEVLAPRTFLLCRVGGILAKATLPITSPADHVPRFVEDIDPARVPVLLCVFSSLMNTVS